MDYAAEQEMEIEALEAIFGDSLQRYEGTVPDGWCGDSIYRVTLKPTDEDEQVERKMALEVLFSYPMSYPDEAPHLRIQSCYGLSDEEITEVQTLVDEEVGMNLGMSMMFHIFETAKEWLRNRANVDASFALTEEEKKRLKEEEEEKRMAEQRSHGIAVTEESFMEWKIAFERELTEGASRKTKTLDPRLTRPTGKQLFLQRPTAFEEDEMDFEDGEGTLMHQLLSLKYCELSDDDDDEDWADAYLAENAQN